MTEKLAGSGDTETGEAKESADFALLSKYPATKTGLCAHIRVKGGDCGVGRSVKVALYANDGGSNDHPGTLLASQQTATLVTANQWNLIPLTTPVQIILGAYYWIGAASDTVDTVHPLLYFTSGRATADFAYCARAFATDPFWLSPASDMGTLLHYAEADMLQAYGYVPGALFFGANF